ncbi:uncharacterized protein LOC122044449 [Zingiber officinale]|uniref:uncharacterized protein LOC122044449 n=1 Tax=Zingiber officinale TaxID=94328 RepID=UPI001C4C011F|nr:uncharacterized protein LOC122044449 [Zingiber officinale]
MAHSPAVNHVCYAIALLCTACYCCQAQDAIQIVANAALCFDNRMVINNCLMSMGINTNGSSGSNGTMSNSTTIEPKPHGKSNATTEKSNATTNSNATTMTLCSSPCYGQMMLTATCMDGILSSFPFYSPGLVQGVQAIVNMSCRGMANSTTNSTTNSTVSHLAEPGPRTNTSRTSASANTSRARASASASASVRAVPDFATLVVSAFSILFIHRRSQISW